MSNDKQDWYEFLFQQLKRRPMAIYIKFFRYGTEPEVPFTGSVQRDALSGQDRVPVADAPGGFPDWRIVYYYFSSWKRPGVIEALQEALVEKASLKMGRKAQPMAGIIDAQSVKPTLVGSESKGFDAGKKVKGAKRHIVTDTSGLVLAVAIQSASVQDRGGAVEVIKAMGESWKNIVKLFADGGYRGKLTERIKTTFKIQMEVIKRNELHAFKILPKRWVVERTFSCIDANRRNSKNYERLNNTGMATVQSSSIRIMLNRF